MANVAVGDFLQVNVYCQDTEQGSVNTLHYRVQGVGGGSVTLAEIAAEMDNTVATALVALLANTATYRGVGVKSLSVSPAPSEEFNATGTAIGTAGAVGLPRQSAGLLRWKTGVSGPAYRGRSFLPFPSASDNTGLGVPGAGYLANAATLATGLASLITVTGGVGTCTLQLGIYHRARLLPTPVPHSMTLVVDFDVAPVWATQRRRGSEGRPNLSPV